MVLYRLRIAAVAVCLRNHDGTVADTAELPLVDLVHGVLRRDALVAGAALIQR